MSVTARRRPRAARAGALEQHPPLERGRSHHRIALEDLFLHRRKIRRHQSDRLEQAREHAGFGDGFVQEHAAIERLVLGTHDRQPEIGVEIFASHIGQPQRQIGQFREPLDLVRVGDETRGIDDDLAPIEPGIQNFAECLCRTGSPATPTSAR